MRNTPVAIYLGCMTLLVSSIGLALNFPGAEPPAAPAAAPAWPPAQAAVAYHSEMVELLTFESSSAQKAAQEAYAQAAAEQAAQVGGVKEATHRETVRNAPPEKKRKSTRRRHRNDEDTADVVIRDRNGSRSARVPRERDDVRDDARQGYAPEEERGFGPFWGRW